MERILRSTIPISHLRLNMLRIAPCTSYGAEIGRTTPSYQHSTHRPIAKHTAATCNTKCEITQQHEINALMHLRLPRIPLICLKIAAQPAVFPPI